MKKDAESSCNATRSVQDLSRNEGTDISGESFSDDEVLRHVNELKSYGYGQLVLVVKSGKLRELTTTRSYKKTKMAV